MKPRIAYNNMLEDSIDLLATNVDNDSSVKNLYHPYMEYALWCISTTTTISGRWTSPKLINCIGVGFHTCDTVHLKLKSSSGIAIYESTITLEENDALYYFASVDNAYSFELIFQSAEAARIGYLYIGSYVELPQFNTGSEYPISLNSSSDRTRGGQVYGLFARPVQGYGVSFPRFESTDLITITEYIETVQNVKPHMVDLFPDSHSTVSPFYGVVSTDSLDVVKRSESGFF